MSTESPENELAVLRREMELSSLGDKPYSISADKLRRLIELESQASESPTTLPAFDWDDWLRRARIWHEWIDNGTLDNGEIPSEPVVSTRHIRALLESRAASVGATKTLYAEFSEWWDSLGETIPRTSRDVAELAYVQGRVDQSQLFVVGAVAAAKRVADYLFENGSGEHADRLVLMKNATGHGPGQNEKDLGGWCKQSVVDAVLAEFGSASPSDAAEICAEMAREAAANQAKFESGMGSEQELDIAERYKAMSQALREAERRIRAANHE